MTTWTTRARTRTILMDDPSITMDSAIATMDSGSGASTTTWTSRRY